jgi:hypothetical protein
VLDGRYVWAEEGVIDPVSLAPPPVHSEHGDDPVA